ncbi:hypothetical protein Hanom_Chr02g00132261 [Helianthus anomalus]
MLDALGLRDENLKFDIEDAIPEVPDEDYVFKHVEDVDNLDDVVVEDGTSDSDNDVPPHSEGLDDDFPTFTELLRIHNEDDQRRKVAEKISTEGPLKVLTEEELGEERKRWFKKPLVEEKKFKRPLKFFTGHPNESLGDTQSWGYLEDMLVYAIKREHGVQHFKFLKDIKTLPWWDVEELVKTKNLQQCLHSLEVRFYEQRLWRYIKHQATLNFPDWKPHRPKRIEKIDPVTGEKGWVLNPRTIEAVITLFDGKEWRYIHVLDPMWLVNYSKKDIECLFFNKIMYYEADKEQAHKFQKLMNVCFEKDINSGWYSESKWRDLELEEFLKDERRNERINKKMANTARRARWRLEWPVTGQTPIESEERKIPKRTTTMDGIKEKREWWIKVGRHKRQQMLAKRAPECKRKNKEKRDSRRH